MRIKWFCYTRPTPKSYNTTKREYAPLFQWVKIKKTCGHWPCEWMFNPNTLGYHISLYLKTIYIFTKDSSLINSQDEAYRVQVFCCEGTAACFTPCLFTSWRPHAGKRVYSSFPFSLVCALLTVNEPQRDSHVSPALLMMAPFAQPYRRCCASYLLRCMGLILVVCSSSNIWGLSWALHSNRAPRRRRGGWAPPAVTASVRHTASE